MRATAIVIATVAIWVLGGSASAQGLPADQELWYRGYFEGQATHTLDPAPGFLYEPIPGNDWAIQGYWPARPWGYDGYRGYWGSSRFGRDWDRPRSTTGGPFYRSGNRALPGQYWYEDPGRFSMPIADGLRWPGNLRAPADPRQTEAYRQRQERVRRAGHLW